MTDWLTDRQTFVIVESLLRLKNNIYQTSDQNCGQVGNPIRSSEGDGGWGRVGDLWDLRILSPPTSSAFSLSSSPTTASIYHLSATFRWLNINSCSCLCNGLSDLDLIKITNDQMILVTARVWPGTPDTHKDNVITSPHLLSYYYQPSTRRNTWTVALGRAKESSQHLILV